MGYEVKSFDRKKNYNINSINWELNANKNEIDCNEWNVSNETIWNGRIARTLLTN